jgi:hypothetical protein
MADDQAKQANDLASPERDPSPDELFWRQYSLHYDVYKFHLDACVKYTSLLFAITGALLGYYFGELQGHPNAKWILFPGVVMNFCMGIGCFVGGCMVGPRKREVDVIAKRFGFSSPPNMTLLRVVLWLMCLVNLLTAVGLVVLMAT